MAEKKGRSVQDHVVKRKKISAMPKDESLLVAENEKLVLQNGYYRRLLTEAGVEAKCGICYNMVHFTDMCYCGTCRKQFICFKCSLRLASERVPAIRYELELKDGSVSMGESAEMDTRLQDANTRVRWIDWSELIIDKCPFCRSVDVMLKMIE